MMKYVIFSGTTEGRQLSELMAQANVQHTVCVASEYGKEVMNPDPNVEIHVGRMDADGIAEFLKGQGAEAGCMVIDATHPYATEVTDNIKKAAKALGTEYVRIIRAQDESLLEGAEKYDDIEECARAMDRTEGNILLTTGSKELGKFCSLVSDKTKERTYVRVIPAMESLKLCENEGIEQSHIIAMQGPFSRELNEVIIRQYDIKHVITKESGSTGGFREKREASLVTGAKLHVILRPCEEEGITVEEAYKLVTGTEIPAAGTNLKIYLIGLGMGNEGCMTLAAKEALSKSGAVFGAERLIEWISCPKKYAMYLADDIIPVLEQEKFSTAAIVFSGDTGVYSGARKMVTALSNWRPDIDLQVLPGISSFSYLASKLGESYDDAELCSIHGKNTEKDLCVLLDKIKHRAKTFVLLSGASDVRNVAEKLMKSGIEGKICLGSNLSYDNEEIKEFSFEEAREYSDNGIVTALIYNSCPEKRRIIDVKKDTDFIRSEVPMTKEIIRHESIIRLGLREGDIFYDIGGGTGSVAIEAALLDPSLQVYTLEKKPEAVELIKKNIEKAGADNVTVLSGDAAELLVDMPKPDCVFIGGSGGKLSEIVDLLHSKGNGITLVINAVSIETIEEAREVIRKYEPQDENTVILSVSDVQKVGSHHMLKGQNPIWIFSFTI